MFSGRLWNRPLMLILRWYRTLGKRINTYWTGSESKSAEICTEGQPRFIVTLRSKPLTNLPDCSSTTQLPLIASLKLDNRYKRRSTYPLAQQKSWHQSGTCVSSLNGNVLSSKWQARTFRSSWRTPATRQQESSSTRALLKHLCVQKRTLCPW